MTKNTNQNKSQAPHLKLLKGNPALIEEYRLKPRYECTAGGVNYIAIETDKEGNTSEKAPLHLSDPIRLIGRGTDHSGNHYRIIQWQDRITRAKRTAALPMAEIGTQQSWQKLQGSGIAINSQRRKRELLADYLQTEGKQTPYTVTDKSGWCKTAYILPNGEIIAPTDSDSPNIIYNGDTAHAYQSSGTLEEWQTHIARYAAGNSRLCLMIGAALAAPLLHLMGMESGGFHLFGDSRDGKSTAAKAALSVWGKPAELMASWTGTSLGFSNLANARSDNLLVLDEIGQANPRHVSQTAYAVINGVSKIQGAKDGGNRDINRWRLLLLSTGEKPLDMFLHNAKEDWNAGQAARLPSVPSDAGQGKGIFDTLHGYDKGSHLAEAITQNAERYHGTAGRAFIRLLTDKPDTIAEARHLQAGFMATLPDMDGQARTVATRFALVAAALELAARHGITGISDGLAFPAVKQCFDDWLERNGSGKFEDRRIMENALAFAQIHFDSGRFVSLSAAQPYDLPHNFAGYRRFTDNQDEDQFYIVPKIFLEEICQGYDKDKVCSVLHHARWLERNQAGNRWKHQLRGKGRLYKFKGKLPPEELAEEQP
ncbi:DUF927 domain-containing protein [Neisseria sp. ZJ106]|uniref:DUF927 domain-containing protein n=1 Tax=Neisseria lisongii TaxID=2912188 RepID=A0ABY7RK70_9NEIS|nr:DUF927 domain-containing protein [Neisseria lisongii]MCF7520444.1 DUF927 domain-containing protein [Neisseria lisongii]WCL71613.1 DUF927 domain-containing protein [Neisseria lisongii]